VARPLFFHRFSNSTVAVLSLGTFQNFKGYYLIQNIVIYKHIIMRKTSILFLTILFLVCSCKEKPTTWTYKKEDGGWNLYKNGEEFYIKGGVPYNIDRYYGKLKAIGGNTVRVVASRRLLDEAKKNGLYAFVNLPVKGDRDGFDWDDESAVLEQENKILSIVEELKDHKSVMAWSLGNELSYVPGEAEANPMLWYYINNLAKKIKKIDPNHIVGFCIGYNGCEVIAAAARDGQDLDFLGMNAYRKIERAATDVEANWDKPFIISEWGTEGRWEVEDTIFLRDIEPTSSEKAKLFEERYISGILPFKNCIGSLAFFWGERNEGTPTWFGLFVDGRPTESIGVLKKYWTGSFPYNQAPSLSRIRFDEGVMNTICDDCKEMLAYVENEGDLDRLAINPFTGKQICNRLYSGQVYHAFFSTDDPDNDRIVVTAEVRPDPKRVFDDYAGSKQGNTDPVPNSIISSQIGMVSFRAPAGDGSYRLLVYVEDANGNLGHANIPFHVGDWRERELDL